MTQIINSRNILFLLFSIITLVMFYEPLKTLFAISIHDETYDYIILIPLVSVYFFYLDRKKIFSNKQYSLQAGIGIIIIGVIFYMIGMIKEGRLNQNDFLSIISLSIVTIWIGGFVLFYGLEVFRMAVFPLVFLLFIVPLPTFLLEKVIAILQEGSAVAAYFLLQLLGVPVLREGFIFHLTVLSVEVAKQCSGIHSAIALFITSLIIGKLFLATIWRRGVLTLSVIPITIMKNGLRIATLSLLGNYIDERILSSPLHREGGIPFFLLAVSFLLAVLWILRRSEKRKMKPSE